MLREYPKEAVLKDGEKVTLRPMVREDERGLLEFFSRLPENDKLSLRDDVTDPKLIESWAKNLDFEHVIPILAQKESLIIGDATLHIKTSTGPPRTAEIRIVTDPDFRRRGLGTILAKEIYFLALSLKIDQLIAEVFEDRPAVLATCESLGFRRDRVEKTQGTDIHGEKRNLVIMTQDVRALWKKIEEQLESDKWHYSRG